jgi:hypothetical protein
MTMWGSAQTVEASVSEPVACNTPLGLNVDFDPGAFVDERSTLTESLRRFFTQGEFCDIVLQAAGGETFSAHAVVMGMLSNTFRGRLLEVTAKATAEATAEATSEAAIGNAAEKGAVEAAPAAASTAEAGTANVAASDQTVATPVTEGASDAVRATCGRPQLLLNGISPEAVKSMLDFAYGSSEAYAPTNDEVNQHVLKLAAEFDIAGLRECASVWLTRELDSSNVVQRLATCNEFQLKQIYEAITEELVASPLAVASICNDMKIMQQPRLLQDLLVRMVRSHADRQKSMAAALDSCGTANGVTKGATSAATTEAGATDKSTTDATGMNVASANVAKTKATGPKTLKSSRSNIAKNVEDLDLQQGKRQRIAGA